MDVKAEMLNNNSTYHYDRPYSHYARPTFLEECINRCKNLHKNPVFLKKIGPVSNKLLEALKSFSQALLHYTDIVSFKYGIWNKQNGKFINFDLKILKKVTKLSTYYFYHCIKLLKNFGYLFVERAYKSTPTRHIDKGSPEYNKAFKAAPAMRKLSLSFFIDLGFNRERIETCQRGATNKRIDKVREERKIVPTETSYDYLPNREPVNKSDVGKSHISKLKKLLKRFGRSVQKSGP